ncbi:MAG: hypothetical protein Q8P06_01135 [Candidatus Azambacteria bacterium]|nr:hypothetical protein [Candidatus Azambacteria bacterium]
MERIDADNRNSSVRTYLKNLKEKRKKSRVYSRHQSIGLALGEILEDRSHKILYISLAKKYDPDRLLALAKDIAQREGVKNRGAYFMKVFKTRIDTDFKRINTDIKKKKQLKLGIKKRKIK